MAEFKAATVEEATKIGLETLGLTAEQAMVTVLEEGGKLFKKARVDVAPRAAEEPSAEEQAAADEPAAEAESDAESAPADGESRVGFGAPKTKESELVMGFVADIAGLLDAACEFSVKETSDRITVRVEGAGSGKLIGYRGDVLDAVQYIASVLVNRERKRYKRVTVDCENYREKREESLVRLAERLAEKAVRTGRKVRLEPMNPAERRVIHSTLQKNEEVETVSVGNEPNRYLTIVPKNLRDDREEREDRRGSRNGRRDGGRPSGRNDRGERGERSGDRRGGGRDCDRGRGEGRGPRPAKKSAFLGFGSYLGNTKSTLEREIYEERKREFEKNQYIGPEEAEEHFFPSAAAEPATKERPPVDVEPTNGEHPLPAEPETAAEAERSADDE